MYTTPISDICANTAPNPAFSRQRLCNLLEKDAKIFNTIAFRDSRCLLSVVFTHSTPAPAVVEVWSMRNRADDSARVTPGER